MSRLEIAKTFVQDKEFDQACYILEKNMPHERDAFYFLSLLYRFLNRYEDEAILVQDAHEKFHGDDYFVDRKKFHNKPLFERLVPRQPVRIEGLSKYLPSAMMLEQLCFITCASSHCFTWLIELIESIQNTARYKDLPFCIVDLGLNDKHRDYLTKLYKNIVIRSIPDTIPLINEVKRVSPAALANHIYSFFEFIFPEYEYFLLLETDTWVQDERSLDNMIFYAEKSGFAKANYNYGVMCYRKGTSIIEDWRKTYLQNAFHNNQYNYYASEKTCEIAFKQHNLNYFCADTEVPKGNQVWTNYGVDFFGLPITRKNCPILRNPENFIVIGVIHNLTCGNPDNLTVIKRFPDEIFYVPTLFLDRALMPDEYSLHRHTFSAAILHKRPEALTDLPEEYSNRISLRYRVWPWADKQELENLLMEISGA